jgi:beta-phosphoglucomutase
LIRALIFDLDGVIVDTARYHFIAWKKIAESLKIPFGEIENEKLKGVSRIDSLEKILNWGGITLSKKEKKYWLDIKNKFYLDCISQISPKELLPGVSKLIEESKQCGFKIALGSASKNAIPILKKVNLINSFDEIVDGTIVSLSKPNPEVFLRGAELLNLLPEQCLVFEDAQSGIFAAKNAQMKCVAIGNTYNLEGAEVVIESLEEISDIKLFISEYILKE